MDKSQQNHAEGKSQGKECILYYCIFFFTKFWKIQTNLEWQIVTYGLPGEESMGGGWRVPLQRGRRKHLGVMNMFIIFITVLISCVYTCVKTCQIVHFKCPHANYTLAHVHMTKWFKNIFKKGVARGRCVAGSRRGYGGLNGNRKQ